MEKILKISKQTIRLLPEKAIYWEEKGLIAIADLHLGKVSTFQKMGIPVPEGSMEEDLARLDQLLNRYAAKECVIIGDFIHSAVGLTDRIKREIELWLGHQQCNMTLIYGNHDRPLIKNLPKTWKLNVYEESYFLEPFYFSHHPTKIENFFVWSGHLHPQFYLYSKVDFLKLPCFFIEKKQGILPAFGSFTGGYPVEKKSHTKIFITTGSEVIEV